MLNITHKIQPNYFTCGITCISMFKNFDIDEYYIKYNINEVTGTVSKRINKFFKVLINITFIKN
jgi:hypothetical protein